MAGSTKRIDRRPDALSKERIVEAAIAILDAEGESALTFRALGARLATGSGAIYWHVANKDELLQAAADDVLTRALGRVPAPEDPQEAIRAAALAVYDAIDGRPWVGSQLTREPTQAGGMLMFERFGEPLAALGVPEAAWFDCASALHNAVLGFAAAPVVITEPSETKRFGTSWARPNSSTTPSEGSALMRHVPRLCVDG